MPPHPANNARQGHRSVKWGADMVEWVSAADGPLWRAVLRRMRDAEVMRGNAASGE